MAVKLWSTLTARHRAKVAERRALDEAAREFSRAGVDGTPTENPWGRIRAWLSGQGGV